MSALPAATASRLSRGTASAVFWSLRPPLGAWTASALVIFPPLTVTRTWTAPYWVCATSPVTVRACAAGAWGGAEEPDEPDDPDEPAPPADPAAPDVPPPWAFALSSADCSDFLYPALV